MAKVPRTERAPDPGGRRVRVVMFQSRFVHKILSGEKRQTIRRLGKRNPPAVGERLSLRFWTGSPYRSPQSKIANAVVVQVRKIQVDVLLKADECVAIVASNGVLTSEEMQRLAMADGFDGVWQMVAWFRDNHGLPFEGHEIRWRLARKEAA